MLLTPDIGEAPPDGLMHEGEERRQTDAAPTHRTPTSGLRRFLSELRQTWRDPTIPPPVPQLRDYPVRTRT
jgi:hypothetical protein